MTAGPPLIDARRLVKHFAIGGAFTRDKGVVRAVDDISFTVGAGRTLGVVGE